MLEVVGHVRCEGTFYVWFELPEGVTAATLIAVHCLPVAPGEGFSARGSGSVRISVATGDEAVDSGLRRLTRAPAAT